VSQSLSSQDVVAYLGSEEFSKGEFVQCVSLVFMMQDMVYKMPLTLKAQQRLSFLYNLTLRGTSPKQVLLPHDQKKNFFMYYRLEKPLDIKPLKDSYLEFAASVINALDELHGLGFAHLDVRLPNICFREHNAVLIDLDDCLDIGETPGVFSDKSHMYSKY